MNCPCDEFFFPAARAIPAGLSGDALRMARMLGGYPQWRRAVLEAIAHSPALDSWRAREEHDLGLMLAEMGAVVFDGVAFYNAMIGAEAYLGTARMSGAQRRLVALLGYRPRPAIAAEMRIALLADGVRVVDVPAGAAFRTGTFTSLVKGVAQPQPAQVFELERPGRIDPFANQFTVARTRPNILPQELKTLLVQPSSLRLRVGQLMVLSFAKDLCAVRVIDITQVRQRSGIPAARLRFDPVTVAPRTGWSRVGVLADGATATVLESDGWHNDDMPYPRTSLLLNTRLAIPVGSVLLFESGDTLAARHVSANTDELCVALPAQISTIESGGSSSTLTSPAVMTTRTRLTLSYPLKWTDDQVRGMVLHHSLSRAAVPLQPEYDTLEQDDEISLPGMIDAPRIGIATLALEDAYGVGVVCDGTLNAAKRIATVAAAPAWSASLTAPVQLYGNVLTVSRGESVLDELLGMSDGTQEQQVFTLKKAPLTYLNAATASGRRSTLELRVAGVLWHEVPTFYGTGAREQVYIVRHDEAGTTFITIGGAARLPSGVEVRASYRFGAGAAMPPAGALSQLAKPVPGVRGIRSTVAATGGADAESAAALAVYAPRTALLLARAISLPELEALAAQAGDVIAVRATWAWDAASQRPAALLRYITSAAGDAVTPVETALKARLRAAMEDDAPLAVQRSLPQPASLTISLLVDARYVAENVAAQASAALLAAASEIDPGGLLQASRLGPDGPVFLSHLVAALMALDGVAGINAVAFDGSAFTQAARAPAPGHHFDFNNGGVTVSGTTAAAGNANGG